MAYRRTLTEDEKEKLAYELALGYYEPEQLRHVFELLPQPFEQYLDSTPIQQRVITKRREIDESDSALRILARRAARISVDELSKIVKDEEAPAKTRMEAGRQLREYAFAADKGALERGESGDGAVYIKTNLDLGEARGVYTVTAEEIDEQEAENAAAFREEHGDELAELIGL